MAVGAVMHLLVLYFRQNSMICVVRERIVRLERDITCRICRRIEFGGLLSKTVQLRIACVLLFLFRHSEACLTSIVGTLYRVSYGAIVALSDPQ